jgi:hypothetical protein
MVQEWWRMVLNSYMRLTTLRLATWKFFHGTGNDHETVVNDSTITQHDGLVCPVCTASEF